MDGRNRNGGARPGAGRKPKTEKFASAINRAEKRIADRLPDLVDRLFELAEGVTMMEFTEGGGERVYTKPPDFKAASYLIDRVMGKPVQSVNADVEADAKLRIVVEYADAAPEPPEAACGAEASIAGGAAV